MKLISYTGRAPVEVDLATAEKRAKAAGKAFPRQTRGGTLYLRPGTTATLSEEEFEALRAAVPAALRFVTVHPAPAAAPAPEVPARDLGAPGPVAPRGGPPASEPPVEPGAPVAPVAVVHSPPPSGGRGKKGKGG